MKRIIEKKLVQWKRSRRRKPLIVRGARQVGKTYSIKHFGQDHFDAVALVDLERNSDWHRIFEGSLNVKIICAELEVLLKQKIVAGKTLLFFDEIQACPRAVTALRYFYEQMPELHVVAAGSLLEFAIQDISFPVGRLQLLRLHPLCFAEYLEATGNSEARKAILGRPEFISETIHEFLCEELRRYFFVGGMPESVMAYVETGSMQESFEVQAEICETYRMDFAKYSSRADKHCLNAVLTNVARSVGQQIKYSRLAEDYSNPTIKKAFELLCMAKVIRKVPSVDPWGLPLGATASTKIFKAVMVDIGLMRHLSGMPTDVEYSRADLLTIYRGAMAEQFAGQEMALSQEDNLYYWSRRAKSSSAEVDYVSVIDGKIAPVEVKSGAAGRMRSLHSFLQAYPGGPGGLVFSMRPFAGPANGKITFLPLYFAFSETGGEY